MLVLPRVEPVRAAPRGGGRATAGDGLPTPGAEVDLDGLRVHRPGAPASRIAWQVYARTGELHERNLRAGGDARPLIVVDLSGASDADDGDAAVRAAASLTVHLAERGGCALLLPGERRTLAVDPGLRGWPAAHARLALVPLGARPALAALTGRTGPVIWVSARPLREPPRALVHASGSARVLVVPGALAGRHAAVHRRRVHGLRARRSAAQARPRPACGRRRGGRVMAVAAAAAARARPRLDAGARRRRCRASRRSSVSRCSACSRGRTCSRPPRTGAPCSRRSGPPAAARAWRPRARSTCAGAVTRCSPAGRSRSSWSPCSAPRSRHACCCPSGWEELVRSLLDGLAALPGTLVPYGGADVLVRRTLLLGGTALVAIAVLQGFWPREAGRPPGSPAAAMITLGTLYAVPVISRSPERPFLSGAVFTLLLCAFLFADRLSGARVIPALLLVGLVTVGAAAAAPALDRPGPWVNYETLAEDVAGNGTVGYRWDHGYGPLDWPREGRELLRIEAQTPSYWKAEALDTFDGRVWRRAGSVAALEPEGDRDRAQPQWTQTITVRVRGLRSSKFVTAGSASRVFDAPRQPVSAGAGTFETQRGVLRRGAEYKATVYTPRPTAAQLATAGAPTQSLSRQWLRVGVPEPGAPLTGAGESPAWAEVSFPPFGTQEATLLSRPASSIDTVDGAEVVAASALGRIYDLSRRLRARSDSAYDYVRRVRERVQEGASYTERPAVRANPLDAFLFDDRVRLLPALLRSDGAAAADGRRARAGGRRILAGGPGQGLGPVRRARLRRPLVGRGLLPALRLGHLRPDARRLAGARTGRRPAGGPDAPGHRGPRRRPLERSGLRRARGSGRRRGERRRRRSACGGGPGRDPRGRRSGDGARGLVAPPARAGRGRSGARRAGAGTAAQRQAAQPRRDPGRARAAPRWDGRRPRVPARALRSALRHRRPAADARPACRAAPGTGGRPGPRGPPARMVGAPAAAVLIR